MAACKLADFAIHDGGDYRELPYSFGREPARAVSVGGTCVYNPPHLLLIEIAGWCVYNPPHLLLIEIAGWCV
jgi:hypothetical protein